MPKNIFNLFICFFLYFFSNALPADIIYELNGSSSACDDAPLSGRIQHFLEKVIIVDPKEHVWGAYTNGKLIRWGLASAGANWCMDLNRSCRTNTGTFRINSLGDASCISKKFPLASGGGAPMPYCMYFNGGQAIHGSSEVDYGNVSHGCVRIHISDAKWLRYQFVEAPSKVNHYRGTKIIIKNYASDD